MIVETFPLPVRGIQGVISTKAIRVDKPFVKVGSVQARQTPSVVSVVEQTRLDQLDLDSNEFRASVAPLFYWLFLCIQDLFN